MTKEKLIDWLDTKCENIYDESTVDELVEIINEIDVTDIKLTTVDDVIDEIRIRWEKQI